MQVPASRRLTITVGASRLRGSRRVSTERPQLTASRDASIIVDAKVTRCPSPCHLALSSRSLHRPSPRVVEQDAGDTLHLVPQGRQLAHVVLVLGLQDSQLPLAWQLGRAADDLLLLRLGLALGELFS